MKHINYISCQDLYSLILIVHISLAQCSGKDIPNSDSSSSSPIHHGEVLIITCDEGYSSGQGISTSSACSHGIFSPPLPSCYGKIQNTHHQLRTVIINLIPENVTAKVIIIMMMMIMSTDFQHVYMFVKPLSLNT